uniref:Uncharacterized protein n=1 Tax=Oryza punctata TaxID=4537 RepID=A0A0E0K601_ORYPU
MAAELERQFAGYKQRLAERSGAPLGDDGDDDADARGGGEEEDGDGGDVKGRRYEAYTRRRDERLREGWRARMERKEAEVKALWAQLERGGGRAAGCATATTDDGGGAAGEKAGNDGEKRRRSDVAAPASRISGKKHTRTRSFSSSATKSSLPDAGARRALSQEPPPSTSEAPHAAAVDGGAGSHRVAQVTGGGATAAPRRRVFSGHRSSAAAKEHGSSAKGGTKPKPKLPLFLPRRSSSGGLENLKEAVLSNTCPAVAPVQSCSSEQATAHGETGKASPPSPFAGAAAANAPATSPDSDCGEAVDNGAYDQEAETKRVGEHDAEEVTVSPQKANGDITSDSDTEPSYVYVKKDDVEVEEEDAMARRSEALAVSDAKPAELEEEKKNSDAAARKETTAPPSDAAAESATTIAEEAPARESSDESSSSSFSGSRSGGSPPSSAPASYISRAPSIERLLEEDAALLRKKRQQSADKLALMTTTMSTPLARVSGAARSPREAMRGFKRFLSFGKKNRGGRDVTVIDCTSPSVPSVADDDSGSGGWQSGDTIKPRMASSDAASDDMVDHGYAVSPQGCSLQSLVAASPAKSELHEIDPQEKSPKAHRSFFSFRSFNCGRS